MLFVIFIPSTFTHFILTFLKVDYGKRINVCNYLISLFLGLTVYTRLFARDIGPFLVFPYWLKPRFPFFIHSIHFFTNIIYSHFLMLRAIKYYSGILKNQVLYIFIGPAIGFSAGAINYLTWYRVPIPPFLNFLVSISVVFVSYAIIKYRLMDIRVALTRAGVFIAVYLLVLGIPFWIGFKYLGQGPWILPVSIMAVFATAGPFIYIFLQRRAEDALLKERRRYQETINNLSETMIEIRDIEKLLPTITSTVGEAVKIKFAMIFLKQDEYKSFQLKSCYPKEAKSRCQELIPLDDALISILNQRRKPLLSEEIGHQDKINLDSGVLIPCFGKEGLRAILVLGAKANNQMYTPDDLLVFETLSYNTSFAIENCTFWKEIEDRHRKARLQEMDAFSYSLAHEIDNPMTFVCNLARFLKEHFLKYITDPEERKEVEEMCNIIMEGSERVMGMVKAIRQFGQKTTGELEPLNLQEVIEGFFKLYSPELKANFIIFSKEMPDEIIYVKGVAAELQQVLMIFAKNAIHAMMYSQEKKIYLKVIKVNQSTVRIAVSDTGYGIKKENLHTIFEPFFTSKASTEGTGMGLHNAKGFVLRHQGRIWAESEGEGKGATFIFELPILQDVKPEDFKKKDSKTDWAY